MEEAIIMKLLQYEFCLRFKIQQWFIIVLLEAVEAELVGGNCKVRDSIGRTVFKSWWASVAIFSCFTHSSTTHFSQALQQHLE